MGRLMLFIATGSHFGGFRIWMNGVKRDGFWVLFFLAVSRSALAKAIVSARFSEFKITDSELARNVLFKSKRRWR